MSYELLAKHASKSAQEVSTIQTLMAGGFAGTISWLITFPVDFVKSRLQTDGLSGPKKYNGIIDCVQKCYHEEGLACFSRGLTSTLIRAFPVNAACFLVVSWVLKLCNNTNLNIDITTREQYHVVGSVSTPFVIPMNYYNEHKKIKMNHTIKSLVFLGAFSEAVCENEIIELASEVYEVKDHYYQIEMNRNSVKVTPPPNILLSD